MDAYCTGLNCGQRRNTIPDESLNLNNTTQILCSNCQMPLILDRKFVAIEKLGEGGFGITYKAKDLNLPDITRVIKQLHPTSPSGEILTETEIKWRIDNFRKEARILDTLRHPQIPRLLAFFTMEFPEETGYVQKFFYLVQDYIEGRDLAYELRQNGSFSEDEVINILKEILIILNYIHNYDGSNRYIHRDIKPHNIMRCRKDGKLYLIDFGVVKQILQGVEVETTIVLDPRFGAPEQKGGQVSPASDLYATATTCLSLLTGISDVNGLLLNSNWRDRVSVSDPRFATALNEMLMHNQTDRPQSAQQVLNILSAELDEDSLDTQIPNGNPARQPRMLRRFLDWVRQVPRRWRSIISFIFSMALGIAIAVAYYFIIPPVSAPPFANNFSRGEEYLIPQLNPANPDCKGAYDLKKKGIEAFKKARSSSNSGDFKAAEGFFTDSINQSNPNYCRVDPETFIYQYNSKVAQTASASNASLPTIAVVIPTESYPDIALEILRGVAQFLKEPNTNTPLFQILLVKDNQNLKSDVINLANYISNNNIPDEVDYFKNSQILGVIGRYISTYIWEAGDIFGNKKLVLIATTSTANRQISQGLFKPILKLNNYVFRTASNDSIATQDLAHYIKSNKVLIAYHKGRVSSESLREQFMTYLLNTIPSTNIKDCDLTIFSAQTCINIAHNEAVNVLMLAPDPNNLQKAIDIANLANGNFQILAGDVLYKKQTLTIPGGSANKMVIAVPFHADEVNKKFKSQTRNLWGIEKVSWRTMTSYDATQAFVKALSGNANPTRQNIYDNLNDSSFSAPSATTAEIRFDQDHDRKAVTGVGVLVQFDKSNPNRDEYGFILLQTPPRNQS